MGAYFNSGKAKARLNDYRGAIQDCTKAIDFKFNLIDAYYCRGIAKLGLGDTDGACLDLSKAGELGKSEAYELIKAYCQE